MNIVCLEGRITKDPEIRYGGQSQTAVARFNLAIDRGKDKEGKSKGADFPSCVAFGKVAELIEKYVSKGNRLNIVGKIQTGSYDKDGKTHYTTDIIVSEVTFLDPKPSDSAPAPSDVPEGFEQVTEQGFDDLPF